MADKIFVGLDAATIETAPKFDAYTKVTVTNGENSWSKGTSGGRELTVEIPIATASNGATIAQNILNKVNGFRYQPYSAVDAVISPAAEIGDAITIGGVYGGIYSQDIVFDSGSVSDVSAPNDEEIDSEYPFLSNSERDRIRQKRQTAANTSAIATNTSDIASNTSDISANTTAIGGVANRVSTLEANQITVNYLQANYCEINGATINNIKADIAEFRQIFAGQVQASSINAATLSCGSLRKSGRYADWYSKSSTSYTYVLGGTT